MLTRLGIEPMEIGVNLLAALENGTVFTKEVLFVDETEYLKNIRLAAQNSFNLAFSIAYTTRDNVKLLLAKAFRDSNALAEARKIMTSETVKKDLGKAKLEMELLKNKLSLPEIETKEEAKKKPEDIEENKNTSGTIDQAHPSKEEDKFKKDEEIAQNVLKKLQDEKLEKAEKEARKPRWAL